MTLLLFSNFYWAVLDVRAAFSWLQVVAQPWSHQALKGPLNLQSARSSFCLPVLFLPAGGSGNRLFGLSLLWTLGSCMLYKSGFSREPEPIVVYRYIEWDLLCEIGSWAHEVEKCHNLLSESWRPKKARGRAHRPENHGADGVTFSLDGEVWEPGTLRAG